MRRWLLLLATVVIAAACGNPTGLVTSPNPTPDPTPSVPVTVTPPDCNYPIGPDPNITITFPTESDLNPCGNANFDQSPIPDFDGDRNGHRCFWERIARPSETPHSEYEDWDISAGDGDGNTEQAVNVAPPCVLHP